VSNKRNRGFPLELRVFTLLCGRSSENSRYAHEFGKASDAKSLANKVLNASGPDPRDYHTALDFSEDYLLFSFLRKWKGWESGRNTRQVAIDKWISVEEKMRMVNARLLRSVNPAGKPHRVALDLIFEVQRKIQSVIGAYPPPDIFEGSRWSGGATFDLRRGTPYDKKMSPGLTVTMAALPLLREEIRKDPHWGQCILDADGPVSVLSAPLTVVRGSRFLTVPKDAKTDRVIAAEPTGNSFLQQGIGRYFRSRLKRFGVNLDDQSRNQDLAGIGEFLDLATLDEESASDSISRELIPLLLPPAWSDLLNAVRSRSTRIEGEWIQLQKFSSMGNAFTFELESLVFWAIVSAVVPSDQHRFIGVYGDDIVCPSKYWRHVRLALKFFGFKLNDEKSFSDGPFRESCGRHFFWGLDVTPLFQKEVVSDRPDEVIRLANRLVRWSQRCRTGFYDPFIRSAWKLCYDEYQKLRPRFPIPMIPEYSSADDGFLVPVSWLLAKLDIHGNMNCTVLLPRSDLRALNDRYSYAYTLRRRSSQTADPRGRPFDTVSPGGFILRKRKIPYLSVECQTSG
jgi:hypothetical protein